MHALRSEFAGPSVPRCDVEDVDGQLGYFCPCADCGGCHAGVCGTQVRFMLCTLGATPVIVVMFVLALIGVIR
jgi:hypothetical protein